MATHLCSPELLPPRPLCSAFSVIFCKPSALPFPFQPEGKWHVSGQKPCFRPQASPRPRPSHPGLHARPPRVLSPGLSGRAYTVQGAFDLDLGGPPLSWTGLGQALGSG